ncbi:hypothetical protein P8452_45483 [Trifolium repens]|nr:hypothetical protein P8452_45483 [Trifolium repens]
MKKTNWIRKLSICINIVNEVASKHACWVNIWQQVPCRQAMEWMRKFVPLINFLLLLRASNVFHESYFLIL